MRNRGGYVPVFGSFPVCIPVIGTMAAAPSSMFVAVNSKPTAVARHEAFIA